MTLEDAANILHATIDEVEQNADFILTAMNYIADSSPLIFAHGGDGEVRKSLDAALKLRRTQPTPAYRGLIVQIVAAFEEYMRNFCSAQIDALHSSINGEGNDLNESIRIAYLSKAGRILGHISSGTFQGARFDFIALQRTLPSVLTNEIPIELQSSVFSTRLGSCNSDKLDEIFSLFQLPEPFRKELGAHAASASWRRGASPTAAAQLMQSELNSLIDLRNDLAHGALSTVTIDNVKSAAALIRALATTFSEIGRAVS